MFGRKSNDILDVAGWCLMFHQKFASQISREFNIEDHKSQQAYCMPDHRNSLRIIVPLKSFGQ